MRTAIARLAPALALAGCFSLAPLEAQAELRFAPLFQDHMVVQRDLPIRVFGDAPPGSAVEVRFAEHRATATCGADGRFSLELPAMPAGGPHTLAAVTDGAPELRVTDVLVGEVWLCSGQSNMEWPLHRLPNYAAEVAAATDPELRLFTVRRATSLVPKTTCEGSWSPCEPTSANAFSAVAYFFGRALRRELGVPVGLVTSAWGGTRAEAWTRREALAAEPATQPIVTDWAERVARYPAARAEHEAQLAAWQLARQAAEADGRQPPKKPNPPAAPDDSSAPGALFGGMIEPLVPFVFRGVIWYQGESNAQRAAQYATLFPLLIEDWRAAFSQGDLPFLFVQLAAWGPGATWPELREAQRLTLERVRNTGMAVAIDVGDPVDIHPIQKVAIGERLARLARRMVYGDESVAARGPTFHDLRIAGDALLVTFDDVHERLVARDGAALVGFEIAGDDGVFVAAEARVEGDKRVVVRAAGVPAPRALRYAWSADPAAANLVDAAGLPASPFTSQSPF